MEPEFEELWFETLKDEWNSLAVLPAAPGAHANAVAKALVEVGKLHLMQPVHLIEIEGVLLTGVQRIVEEMKVYAEQKQKVLISADAVATNHAAIPIVRAADKILLVVNVGETDFHAAEHTIEIVGRERILGSVAWHPKK